LAAAEAAAGHNRGLVASVARRTQASLIDIIGLAIGVAEADNLAIQLCLDIRPGSGHLIQNSGSVAPGQNGVRPSMGTNLDDARIELSELRPAGGSKLWRGFGRQHDTEPTLQLDNHLVAKIGAKADANVGQCGPRDAAISFAEQL